jgi:N,N'-diacetyllegionaminate synthase
MTSNALTVVAEAAQGFEGDPTLAGLLVRAAAAGKADAVKFQLVYADELATPDYEYFGLFRGLEMSDAAWGDVAQEAAKHGLQLAFDVFGQRSLSLALKLKASAVKLHVSDFFNEPLFDAVVRSAPQTYFSAGGINASEVSERLARYSAGERAKLTMMIGFQAEPTKLEDNHIRRIESWRQAFPALRLGFMDHADGECDEAGWLGVLAVGAGVCLVEKHITLDRALRLEDYVSAATPGEFARYSARLRNAATAYGSAELELTDAELQYRRRAVKSLVAARDLLEGTTLNAGDLKPLRAPLRPQSEPLRFFGDALGRRLRRAVAANRAIYREDLI